MIGATIGQYRVLRLLGQGGMGAVYAGEHALLGRIAAIKVLLPAFSRDTDVVQRFFNEAKAATAIQHPGIVEIFDFGWAADGSAYIVMELLRGESLTARLARERLPWNHALTLLRQIAGALAAAHARGIVHRDLKPDNIYLVPDPEVPSGERVKLLDFGIAKLANDPGSTNKTRTGSVMGTPTYMAPEQCRGVAVDLRADLYSLGCILFEIIAGQPPFVGEGAGDVLAAHIHVPPPLLSDRVQGLPSGIERLVHRLLAKSPGDRVQSAHELISAIDAIGTKNSSPAVHTGPWLASSSVATKPTTLSGAAASSFTNGSDARPRRSRWLVGVGVLAVLGIVIGTFVARENDTTADTETVAAAPASSLASTPPPPTQAPAPAPASAPPAVPSSEPVPAKITVAIDTTPPGARVLIDGALAGTSPYRGERPQAKRKTTIVVEMTGYRTQTFASSDEAPITLDVRLERKPVKARVPGRNASVNPFE